MLQSHHDGNNKEIKKEENSLKSAQRTKNFDKFSAQIANYKLFIHGSSFFFIVKCFFFFDYK